MAFKYFAYGSNMDPDEFRGVSPAAVFISTARLQGHRLDFTRCSIRRRGGVADIVSDFSAETWGVLYEADQRALEALDEKEGVQSGAYKRIEVDVVTPGGENVHSITYSVVSKVAAVAPSQCYFDLITGGARYRGLPEDYIEALSRYVAQLRHTSE